MHFEKLSEIIVKNYFKFLASSIFYANLAKLAWKITDFVMSIPKIIEFY